MQLEEQVNKLYGISFGEHQMNSVRIGWRASQVKSEIELFSYVYDNGERFIKPLKSKG